ncbi:MAG: DNA methyltransferase, partial [Marinobacter alexandrii]|uniref:DNA methyltransferase n=1 Tax=Marinobacter alexandrii TaxID=2570351 RepID=UPI0032997A1E
ASCWIFWDKDQYGDFADGELAWTSFQTAVRKFKWTWNGFRKQQHEDRIHPTQKPVALYTWIFDKYASEGDLILDTHLGSGSSRIAANKAGLDFVGFELDEDYFKAQEERWKNHVSQTRLF